MSLKMDPTPLDQLPDGVSGTIVSMALSPDDQQYLGAMGMGPGRGLQVLRRAVWRGPLHVRLDTGAEFALDRALAGAMLVQRDAP